jgi:hypothetical protein
MIATGSRKIVVNASRFEAEGYWITPKGDVQEIGSASHEEHAQDMFGLSRRQAIQKGYTRVNVGDREFNVEHNGTLNPEAAKHLIPEMAAHIRRGGRAFVNQKEVRRVSDIMGPKEEDHA